MNTPKYFDCEECGHIHEAFFDGYHFGDRLLEGVMFRAKIVDGELVVTPKDDHDAKYLHCLNETMWLKAAKDYALENDIFECPHCKGEVIPDTMMVED